MQSTRGVWKYLCEYITYCGHYLQLIRQKKATFSTDMKNKKNVLEFLFHANHLQFGAEPQRQSVHCLSYRNVAPQNAKK